MNGTRWLSAVSVGASVVLVATAVGCGSSGSPSGKASGGPATSDGKRKLTRVVVATAATGIYDGFAQLYLSATRGYMKDEGIDLVIKNVGGALVTSTVASGGADLGNTSVNTPLSLTHQGKPTKMIYAFQGGGDGSNVASAKPDIHSVDQCRTVMTTSVGTLNYAWAVVLKQLFDASYAIRQTSDPTVEVSSLAARTVDCAIGTKGALAPTVAQGKAHWVFNSATDKPPARYPQLVPEGAVWGTEPSLDKLGRDTVERFVKAYARAGHDVTTMEPKAIAASMLTYPGVEKPENLAQMTAGVAGEQPYFNPKGGNMTERDWPATLSFYKLSGLDFIQLGDPQWAYANNVDMSYWKAAQGGSGTSTGDDH